MNHGVRASLSTSIRVVAALALPAATVADAFAQAAKPEKYPSRPLRYVAASIRASRRIR